MCCVTCIRIYGSIYLSSSYRLIVYTCTLILITLSFMFHNNIFKLHVNRVKLKFDVYKLLHFYMINSHLDIIYIVYFFTREGQYQFQNDQSLYLFNVSCIHEHDDMMSSNNNIFDYRTCHKLQVGMSPNSLIQIGQSVKIESFAVLFIVLLRLKIFHLIHKYMILTKHYYMKLIVLLRQILLEVVDHFFSKRQPARRRCSHRMKTI